MLQRRRQHLESAAVVVHLAPHDCFRISCALAEEQVPEFVAYPHNSGTKGCTGTLGKKLNEGHDWQAMQRRCHPERAAVVAPVADGAYISLLNNSSEIAAVLKQQHQRQEHQG